MTRIATIDSSVSPKRAESSGVSTTTDLMNEFSQVLSQVVSKMSNGTAKKIDTALDTFVAPAAAVKQNVTPVREDKKEALTPVKVDQKEPEVPQADPATSEKKEATTNSSTENDKKDTDHAEKDHDPKDDNTQETAVAAAGAQPVKAASTESGDTQRVQSDTAVNAQEEEGTQEPLPENQPLFVEKAVTETAQKAVTQSVVQEGAKSAPAADIVKSDTQTDTVSAQVAATAQPKIEQESAQESASLERQQLLELAQRVLQNAEISIADQSHQITDLATQHQNFLTATLIKQSVNALGGLTKDVAQIASAAKSVVVTDTSLSRVDGSAARLKNDSTRGSQLDSRPTKPLTPSATARTMERVENALKEAARSRDGKTISLRLDPPSLGSVKVDLTMKNGGLYARLVADSSQVSHLLKGKAHELQQTLRGLGLDLDQIHVSVGSEHEERQGQSQTSSQNDEADKIVMSLGTEKEGSQTGATATAAQGNSGLNTPGDHWVA